MRQYWSGALTMVLAILVAAYAFPRSQPATAAEKTPEAAPAIEASAEIERVLDLAERLLDMTEQILESGRLESGGPPIGTVVGEEAVGVKAVGVKAVGRAAPAAPTPEPPWADGRLLVWETGDSCHTPSDARVARLCGSPDGDGYVVRWVDAPGDRFAGRVASAAFMGFYAAGLDGATLLWSAPHPRTGQAVTIHYLLGDRAIQLSLAGQPLYRIDRQHRYTPIK